MRLPALTLLVLLIAAAPARAGQIVYSKQVGEGLTQLWAMKDDGSGPHLLVDNVPLGMNDLREASVAKNGATIAFTGTTVKYFTTSNGQFNYGINATGLYLWRGGKARRVSGDPTPCNDCSSFETDPSLGPDGRTVTAETFFSSARVGNFGRLLVRPPGGGEPVKFGTTCEDTAVDDPAFSPAGGGLVAYVGCDAQVVVSGPGHAGEHVAHSVTSRGGFAPATRSPAWSPDGSRIAVIDQPGDETSEIWTLRADGSDARRVLTAAKDVSLNTVAYLGADTLLIDAGQDLWTLPASCDSCAFPASATQLTHDGQSSGPAWTAAAVLGGPKVKATHARHGFALKLTLPLAAEVKVSAKGRTLAKKRVKAGTHTLKVRAKKLRSGQRKVSVKVAGFPAKKLTVRVKR